MIRSLLVHLGRFMRYYLVSCFACVLVVPLLFNLAEILLDRVQDADILYALCALLPALISAVLVYRQRLRINSDDLQFYVKNRLGKSKSFLVHYFSISGLLVREICPQRFDIQALDQAKESELHTALMVYKAHGPDDLYAIGNNEQMLINQQVSKLLPLVENMFSLLGLNGEYLALAQRSFLQGVRAQVNVEHELAYLENYESARGIFFCEYIFTTLVRTLLRALPEEEQEHYLMLLEFPQLKEVGARLLQVESQSINSNYHNCYFRLLTQEYFCLKHQAMGTGDCHQYYGHGEQAFRFDGSAFTYQSASDTGAGVNGNKHDFGCDGFGFDFGWQASGAGAESGSYYSYRNSYQEAYEQASSDYARRNSTSQEFGSYKEAQAHIAETKLQKAYRTLELEDQAPLSVVKKQYHKLVFKHHPDHIKNFMELDEDHKAAITSRMQEIVQAYNYIMWICEDKAFRPCQSSTAS